MLLRSLVKVFVLLALLPHAFAAPASGTQFGLNDLSTLLPLPTSEAEFHAMLKPTDGGARGTLIPAPLLQKLPGLVIGGPDPRETKAQLRVVGIRFDPCFQEGAESCRRQIRLVYQPLGVFRRAYSTTDAAIHAFHEFPEAVWQEILADWRKVASGKKSDALSVHPVIAKEGFQGPHWEKLRALVLKYCGEKSLTRLTISTVNLFGTQWTFIGYEVTTEGLKNMRVPRLITGGQTFFGDLGNLREFFGDVVPVPEGESTLPSVWQHSVGARNTLREEELQKAVSRAITFENPKDFNPGNLDCVSCHLAQNTRLWAERSFPTWNWKSMFENERFRSTWNLSNTTSQEGLTNRVRAFGYFVDDPVIAQRVVNETAAAAELLAE